MEKKLFPSPVEINENGTLSGESRNPGGFS